MWLGRLGCVLLMRVLMVSFEFFSERVGVWGTVLILCRCREVVCYYAKWILRH